MKKLLLFAEIAVTVLLLPFAFGGMTSARQIDYEQTAPGVGTAAATTADVTLVKALFEDDVVYVSEITSSNGTDVPAVSAYNSGTKALTVQGLAENTTRTLYVTYGYQRFDDNIDTFWSYLPTFCIFGLAIHVLLQVFRVRVG